MDQDRFATCPRTITEWSWHERLTLAESYVIAGVSTLVCRLKTRLMTGNLQLLNPNTMMRFDADRLARCSYFLSLTTGVSADWTVRNSLPPLSRGPGWQALFDHSHLGTFILNQSRNLTPEGTNANHCHW